MSRVSWAFPMFVVLAVFACLLLILSSPAMAYDEVTTSTPVGTPDPAGSFGHTDCDDCHAGRIGFDCGVCHNGFPGPQGAGPHGLYDSDSGRCEVCHSVHASSGSLKLLPADTIKATCLTCHDGTQGFGVYGALAAQGVSVGAEHSIDTTNVIPGGDPATGGSAVGAFTGESGYLGCDDCHSPHASNTVAPFVGDRQRTTLAWQKTSSRHHVLASSKLLKQQPTGATTATAEYGSDWCLGCHQGRRSGGVVHNHPVDNASIVTTPYVYSNVAILATDAPTQLTVMAGMGGWNRPAFGWTDPAQPYAENRGYLMPYPRTAEQTGHFPICMQCHEDTRDPGTLSPTGVADANPVQITHEDGTVTTDSPRFQNFPHEAENANFLIETSDDLCLNCHIEAQLP